ncbi:MAG: glycosyltransferase [Nitrosomonas sp.]|nr:MAG: glycosyltransferase [Nitrosomonas sp.]
MTNAREKLKHAAIENAKSSAEKNSDLNIRRLSPNSSPILIRDKDKLLIAGIKLEYQYIENNTLHLKGWTIGSTDIALLCETRKVVAEINRFPRNDVLEAFAITSSLHPGFHLIYEGSVRGDFGLRWHLSHKSKTTSIDFLLSLDQASSKLPPKPGYHGVVDQLHDMFLEGWAWNSSSPESHVVAEFLFNDTVIGEASCENFRHDLSQAGIGNGAYGFKWPVPEKIDPDMASCIKVRIKDSDFIFYNNVTATFSCLSRTRCFNGNIDCSWPYYISGVITPKNNFTPNQLAFLSGDNIVAVVDIVQDLNVHSSTYGSGLFSWKVPADMASTAAPPVRIQLPGCGILNLPELQANPNIKEGIFTVANNSIYGRLFVIPETNLDTIPVKIVIGQKIGGLINVKVGDNCDGRFRFPIPHHFSTGEDYLIGVITEIGHVPLRTESDQLEFSYRGIAFGVVDNWNPPYLTGWAIDNSAINHAPIVQLYDGEVLIAEKSCDLPRQDVNRKFNRAGTFGYEIPIPERLYCGKAVNLRVICKGIELNVSANCNIPKMLGINELQSIEPIRRIRGRVEQLTTELVAGWAWDIMRPDAVVNVIIRVDGQAIGSTQANRFSSRLRGNGRSGHQQFLFHLPASLQNGSRRHITVEEANTHFELLNKLNPILFPLVVLPETDQINQGWNYSGSDFARDKKKECIVYRPPKLLTMHKQENAAPPKISMIALNWNGDLMIEDFLASLERNTPSHSYELLIIDHGSIDNSINIIKQYANRLPIRLIERRANYSFSASNNYAADLAQGEYLLFLNNDLILQHACASTMAELLDDPDVGIVGAKLLEPLKGDDGNWYFEPHHEGVRFKIAALPNTETKYYSPHEINGIPVELSRSTLDMPVVTAALMICRKADFFAVGGFCEEYFYGLEDVDFCLKIRQKLGKKILCDLNSSAIHNRSATRDSKFVEKQSKKFYTADIHAKNRSAYIRRFGRQLGKTILRSLLDGSLYYRQQPLRVTFVVTEADMNTARGDYFTALELGIWLRKKFGWEVFFINIGHYSISGTDVLIVMRHDYNIRKIAAGNPGLITVAWIRNRTDEWLGLPEFDDYNIVFASSQKAIDHLYEVRKRKGILLPIATNPERFSPEMVDPAYTSDVVFTGSYHGAVRGAVAMMNLDDAGYQFAIYGYNWEKYPPFASYSRGSLRYDSLSKAYASSKLVIDDSHPVTSEWNSLNSRIFDAIACGKVVITNCVGGAQELFGDKLPTFSTREELNTLIDNLVQDNEKRERLAQELRDIVLAEHTYANRADTFRDGLCSFLGENSLRFAIKIGVPSLDEQEQWGDYHFALGIKRALERKGYFVRIDILPYWEGGLSASDDVVIVLRGLSRYKPQPTAINIMWLISHPDEVSIAEMREYDHIFVASESYAARFKGQLGDKISPLLQCTDPDIFYPDFDESLEIPGVLFVGNSRGQRREVVQHALGAGIEFGVYGSGWQNILPPERILGDYIPNSELRRYYSSTKVVLNDHWPDMRAEGFISNRIFDAGACGALILSDSVDGLNSLFDDAIYEYNAEKSFQEVIGRTFHDFEYSRKISKKMFEIILAGHTFDHRVVEVLGIVNKINHHSWLN